MKEIKLTNCDLVALVDDEDLERCSKFMWCLDGSKAVRGSIAANTTVSLASYILNITTNKYIMVDHKDRNCLNNQKENLRVATASQNKANQKKYKNNTTGYKGVVFISLTRKYQARISYKGRRISLGMFHSPRAAALAYNKAAIKYHEEFARLNEV